MLQGILIVVAFLVVAALMMTKKIPTLLALPLMAVVICIIAGVPMFGKNADGAEIGWLTTVFEAGTVRMGSAIMATIFGAWLGQLMNKTGVTENIIKKSAELGGDPTNTQNVWTANFCEVDVNTCTKKMLPYLWAVSIVGVILGAMLYF